MVSLSKKIFSQDELLAIKRRLKQGSAPVMICGLSPVHRAIAAAAIQNELFCSVAVLTADESSAAAFAHDASLVSGIEYALLQSRDLVFHDVERLSREWEHSRCDIFSRLALGELSAVVGTVEAFLLRTMPPKEFAKATFTIKLGEEQDTATLPQKLLNLGYVRAELVEGVGQFALRGGILDIYPPSSPRAARIEFFGDEPDSMGLFDTISQRRVENIDKITIPPANEAPPDLVWGGRKELAERIRA